MAKKKADEPTDLERLHQWMDSVGGDISLGSSALKSVEASKGGDKLTIVLKKSKPPKDSPQASGD